LSQNNPSYPKPEDGVSVQEKEKELAVRGFS
jgi:hypothetical protein